MSAIWTAVKDQLPEDDQRVLGFIPGNKVFLPGKDLQFETREVVVLVPVRIFTPKRGEANQAWPSLLGRRRKQQPLLFRRHALVRDA